MKLRARLGALSLVGLRHGSLRRPTPAPKVGVVLEELPRPLLVPPHCLLVRQLLALLTP